MTYYVEVKVTKSFKSYEDAQKFSDKVLESTKGEANYDRSIRYVEDKSPFNESLKTFTFNTNTPHVTSNTFITNKNEHKDTE